MKKRKIISGLLVLSMLAGMSLSSFADFEMTNETKDSILSQETNESEVYDFAKSILSNDVEYLSKDEVLTIARQNILAFISDETEYSEKNVYPSENFIDIYDLYGNLFAYIVPLNDTNGTEIGYITIGALKDGFSSYLTSLNPQSIQLIRQTMSQYDNATLVMIPPCTLMVKVEGSEGEKYLDISFDQEAEDVTEMVEKNEINFLNAYSMVRGQEQKSKMENLLLMQENDIKESRALGATLRDESNFVNIGGTYYGCSQQWTTSYQDNGCGPAAAANIMYYMSDQDSDYSALYPYTSISKSTFTQYLEEVCDYLDPSMIGMFSYSQWASKVKSYGSSQGVSMSYKSYPYSYSQDGCEQFIFNGLRANAPVASLNAYIQLRDIEISDLNYHWITITKFNSTSAGSQITFSSWGKKYSFNFDTYYAYASAATNSGLVYFVY